jgi:ABC-type bacteriocin/lantibiotic exporter with double-glycine peptidase domain
MFSFTIQPNPKAVLNKLLKSLSLRISPETISSELEKHSDYLSLLSINDLLTAFDIENEVFRIEKDDVTNVPRPFIIYTNSNYGDFVLVSKIDHEIVVVSSDKWHRRKIGLDQFKKMFTGVVLTDEVTSATEATPTSPTNILAAFETLIIATGLLQILVLALSFHTGYFASLNWQNMSLAIYKIAGMITSTLFISSAMEDCYKCYFIDTFKLKP